MSSLTGFSGQRQRRECSTVEISCSVTPSLRCFILQVMLWMVLTTSCRDGRASVLCKYWITALFFGGWPKNLSPIASSIMFIAIEEYSKNHYEWELVAHKWSTRATCTWLFQSDQQTTLAARWQSRLETFFNLSTSALTQNVHFLTASIEEKQNVDLSLCRAAGSFKILRYSPCGLMSSCVACVSFCRRMYFAASLRLSCGWKQVHWQILVIKFKSVFELMH